MSTALPTPFTDIDLDLADRRVGKVRISYALPDLERLFFEDNLHYTTVVYTALNKALIATICGSEGLPSL